MNNVIILLLFLLVACSNETENNSCNESNLGLTINNGNVAPGSDLENHGVWMWKKKGDSLFIRRIETYPVWNSEKDFSVSNTMVFNISGDCPILLQYYEDYNNTEDGAVIPENAEDGVLYLETEFLLQE